MIGWVAALALAAPDQDELFRQSRDAEQSGAWDQAVAACQEVLQRWPTGPRAETCRRRVDRLERRRDPDGTFTGWSTLEQVRATFRDGDPEQARATVRRLWASRRTGEVVRAEAAEWLARDELASDPGQVMVHVDPWLKREVPGEPALTRSLRELAATALAAIGDDQEAHELELGVKVPAAPSAARLTPVDRVVRDRRRGWLAATSVAVLAAFLALAAAPARRGFGGFVPLGLVPVGIALGGGALLAGLWDPATLGLFPPLGLGLVAVGLVSAWALRGAADRPRWRLAIRVAAALATAAVGYLVLWAAGALDRVGG